MTFLSLTTDEDINLAHENPLILKILFLPKEIHDIFSGILFHIRYN